MREHLLDPRRAAAAAGMEALHDKSPADRRLLDEEAVDVELVVVLGIGDRRLQHLLDVLRDAPAEKVSSASADGGGLAADRLGDEVELARAGAQAAHRCRGLGLVEPALGGWLAHAQLLFAFLSPAWPWKVRVGENSPNLWPIMFSVTSTGMNLWPL